MRRGLEFGVWIWRLGVWVLLAAACAGNMRVQPRCDPLESSPFFEDGKCARELVADTVPRGQAQEDELLSTGRVNGEPAQTFPFPITREVLDEGKQRYEVFCAPCHGLTGEGNGMIVQRGFQPPPSFHVQRLRDAPPGHYFDVITNGFGAMYPYAYRVKPEERWAIIAYIRALQLSQNATLDDVPPEERVDLQGP